MTQRWGTVPIAVLCLVVAAQAGAAAGEHEKVRPAAAPFDLGDVRLLDGPLRDAMIRDQAFLLGVDADRLLHSFRVTAGLPSAATPYGGWEAPAVELRGHTMGHFLSACALMYASTGDERFKTKADGIVAELARVQGAMPSRGFHAGYLSAFPEALFDRVDARERVWAPYYTLHKIMAGLLDVHRLCANRQALDVLEKLADWVEFRVGRMTDERQQLALETEFGGMNEVLANLYAATGKLNYLGLAKRFDHEKVFGPLARGVDPLDGLHANTQIPKVVGAAREYELTGAARYRDIATFFWDRVANHRSFVIGGNSDDEAFFPVAKFSKHLGENSTETCNTYNMLRLTRHVFAWAPSAAAMDFYERGLFNHILASQDPANGMMAYYVPMKPGSFRTYSSPDDSFWCCVGTGMESHAKYGDTIYYRDDSALYVNLFVASEVTWKEKGLVIRQETRFPDEETTRLTVANEAPVRVSVKIRYPSWAQSGIRVAVNGEPVRVAEKPGSYVAVEREWKRGDTVDVRLPMSLRVEAMPDDPKTIALLYGPVVLAGDLGTSGMEDAKRYGLPGPELYPEKMPKIPVFLSDPASVLAHVKPVRGAPLTFKTVGIGRPGDVTLVPFYKLADRRYTVYWKIVSAADLKKREVDAAAARVFAKSVERRTVDAVRIGDAASEKAHNFQGERSDSWFYEGGYCRYARDGWFSYELSVPAGGPAALHCTYWGGETRPRTFDVLVDGERVATQHLEENKPGEFLDVEYAIPERLTRGKQRVTVRFQAPANGTAGAVFGLRLLSRE
jgi:DUF1680 family protein